MAVAQLGSLVTFTAGTTIVSDDIDSNYADIKTAFNNLVTGANQLAGGITIAGSLTVNSALDLGGDIELSEVSPASFSSNQNDFATGTATVQRLTNTLGLNVSITGFAGGRAGRSLLVCNVSTVASSGLNLLHESSSSVAANRILCPNAATRLLQLDEHVLLWYDNTTSRWRMMGPVS